MSVHDADYVKKAQSKKLNSIRLPPLAPIMSLSSEKNTKVYPQLDTREEKAKDQLITNEDNWEKDDDGIQNVHYTDDPASALTIHNVDLQETDVDLEDPEVIYCNKTQFETQYFKELDENGKYKKIDFILAYRDDLTLDESIRTARQEQRQYFLNQLSKNGIEYEETGNKNIDGKTYTRFIKLHATLKFLYCYAEIMAINMPLKSSEEILRKIKEMKKTDEEEEEEEDEIIIKNDRLKDAIDKLTSFWKKCKRLVSEPFRIHDPMIKAEEDDYYTAVYREDRKEFFDITADNENDFFTNRDRIRMVNYALHETKFSKKKDDIGIRKIVDPSKGAFEKIYPLHDGFHQNKSGIQPDPPSLRMFLHDNWGHFKNMFKFQPLDQIRNYFGEKIALYFAFMGFYTGWLIAFSLIGIVVLIYGLATYSNSTYVNEMCQINDVMCPSCDKKCNYWFYNQTCSSVMFTYVFDNYLTLVYAFLVSIWATTFLEFWNRRNYELIYDWDLSRIDTDQEPIRQNYETFATQKGQKRINPVTLQKEPYVTLSQRLPRQFFSVTIVIFAIMLIVGAVSSIIVYRLAVEAVLNENMIMEDLEHKAEGTLLSGLITPSMVASISASCISLVVIIVLNFLYTIAAAKLTELELPRTQQQFDDSYAFKVFCFQFVNYYSTLFYIAFFKDPFAGHPGKYKYLHAGEKNFRWQGCQEGGCSYELAIQLMITMVGKQIFNNMSEFLIPWIFRKIAKCRKMSDVHDDDGVHTRWEHDYILESSSEMVTDYTELAIQFGFATLFSSAFPLAPFFAFLNNLFEIRLDAQKYTKYKSRTVPIRVTSIGIWYPIFRFLSILAVITNGLQIAITSNVIPRIYWAMNNENQDDPMVGFARSTFSIFNVSDFDSSVAPLPSVLKDSVFENITQCSYIDYRTPAPDYEQTLPYWQNIFARAMFFIIFEHLVLLYVYIIQRLIPDEPSKLKEHIKRENYLIQEIMVTNKKRKHE